MLIVTQRHVGAAQSTANTSRLGLFELRLPGLLGHKVVSNKDEYRDPLRSSLVITKKFIGQPSFVLRKACLASSGELAAHLVQTFQERLLKTTK